jgi:hypothetical protein
MGSLILKGQLDGIKTKPCPPANQFYSLAF